MTFQEEPPAEYGTHLYWLWGWGERLQKQLKTHGPNAILNFYYQPDSEASRALMYYSSEFRYPIETIERFRANCDKHRDAVIQLPNEDNTLAFAVAVQQLLDRIFAAVDIIVTQGDANEPRLKNDELRNSASSPGLRNSLPTDSKSNNSSTKVDENEAKPIKYDESKVVAKSKSGSVILFDQPSAPIVNGVKVSPLSAARYDVVLTLLEANRRLSSKELEVNSGHTDARRRLDELRHIENWSEVILMSGKERHGYGIK